MTPLGAWMRAGPTSSGAQLPRPPPSIIAGPPMPIEESAVAMMTSQQPSSAALPAKQRPATTPITGTRPDSRANSTKVGTSRPLPKVSVSPGRPPPPSANSTTGSRRSWARASMRSSFLWFM